MILTPDFSRGCETQDALGFWQRLLNEEELQRCEPLEKLLVGCEIIAALDGVDLLAA
ncbi:MAG TPA: hypothetical protein VGL24_03625 [Chthoniobacterales bacterium]|jgi:hypothetical protein